MRQPPTGRRFPSGCEKPEVTGARARSAGPAQRSDDSPPASRPRNARRPYGRASSLFIPRQTPARSTVTREPPELFGDQLEPAPRPRQRDERAPRRAQRDAVHGARDHRELAVGTERAGAVEAAPCELRADTGNAGKGAVERSVHDPQPLPAQRLDGQPIRDPRSEPEHPLDRPLRGAGIETPPPIEKPSSSVRGAAVAAIAGDACRRCSRRDGATTWPGSAPRRSAARGKRGRAGRRATRRSRSRCRAPPPPARRSRTRPPARPSR